MVAHGQPHPVALTESAREARKSFYCDLCQKGYGRINEFEAHEGSYDHLHKKRLKEMKALSRDPSSAAKARKAEAKESAVISIKPISSTQSKTGGGFKKGGFKNAFALADECKAAHAEEGKKEGAEVATGSGIAAGSKETVGQEGRGEGSEDEADGLEEWERYDPRRPTGCSKGCKGWREVKV